MIKFDKVICKFPSEVRLREPLLRLCYLFNIPTGNKDSRWGSYKVFKRIENEEWFFITNKKRATIVRDINMALLFECYTLKQVFSCRQNSIERICEFFEKRYFTSQNRNIMASKKRF